MQRLLTPEKEVSRSGSFRWKAPLVATAALLTLSGCGAFLNSYSGRNPTSEAHDRAENNNFPLVTSSNGAEKWECRDMPHIRSKALFYKFLDIPAFNVSATSFPTQRVELSNLPGVEKIEYTVLGLVPPPGQTPIDDVSPLRKPNQRGSTDLNGYSLRLRLTFYDGSNRPITSEDVMLETVTQPKHTAGEHVGDVFAELFLGETLFDYNANPIRFIHVQDRLDVLYAASGMISARWDDKFGPVFAHASVKLFFFNCPP